MIYSKALAVSNYCSLLGTYKQIKFGVLSACNQNAKFIKKINEDIAELEKLAEQKPPSPEELQIEYNTIDLKYDALFVKIRKELVESIDNVELQAFDMEKKPIAITTNEILSFLENNNIIV